MAQRLRCFVAIELSPSVLDRAARLAKALQAADVKANWVAPEKMHLTLKFLGDADALLAPQICKALAQAVAGQAPFDLAFRGAGAFPSRAAPRTLWLGVGEGSEPLAKLFAAIELALAPLGFPPENRRFTPHLTLARVRSLSRGAEDLAMLLEKNAEFRGGETEVDEVVLFASELERDGPTYTVLGRAALQANPNRPPT